MEKVAGLVYRDFDSGTWQARVQGQPCTRWPVKSEVFFKALLTGYKKTTIRREGLSF